MYFFFPFGFWMEWKGDGREKKGEKERQEKEERKKGKRGNRKKGKKNNVFVLEVFF